MLVDTDVFIWYLRQNERASRLLSSLDSVAISSVTCMEIIQGLKNKKELFEFKKEIANLDISIIHINESISNRATFLMEQFFLSHALEIADSLIAATSLEKGLGLVTGNDKHYKMIPGIVIHKFRH